MVLLRYLGYRNLIRPTCSGQYGRRPHRLGDNKNGYGLLREGQLRPEPSRFQPNASAFANDRDGF
jgi:hypothetical protein